jgi:hypothetical protein
MYCGHILAWRVDVPDYNRLTNGGSEMDDNWAWTYNSPDLPATMTYPDGEVVTHNYNNRMLLNSLIGTGTKAHAELRDSFERLRTWINIRILFHVIRDISSFH